MGSKYHSAPRFDPNRLTKFPRKSTRAATSRTRYTPMMCHAISLSLFAQSGSELKRYCFAWKAAVSFESTG